MLLSRCPLAPSDSQHFTRSSTVKQPTSGFAEQGLDDTNLSREVTKGSRKISDLRWGFLGRDEGQGLLDELEKEENMEMLFWMQQNREQQGPLEVEDEYSANIPNINKYLTCCVDYPQLSLQVTVLHVSQHTSFNHYASRLHSYTSKSRR